MLNRLGIDQPKWQEVTTLKSAKRFAADVGYPLLHSTLVRAFGRGNECSSGPVKNLSYT